MDSAYGFFPGIFFQRAKSIVMQTSVVFGPKSQNEGGGGGVSEGAPPVEGSQASDIIM